MSELKILEGVLFPMDIKNFSLIHGLNSIIVSLYTYIITSNIYISLSIKNVFLYVLTVSGYCELNTGKLSPKESALTTQP